MTTLPSVCPLDCPDRCSLSVTVENGAIQKIAGSHTYPYTNGYICKKVADFGERVHGPLRILHPSIRVGPKGPGARFEPISWPEAIARIAEKMRSAIAEDGAESILPAWYAGSNGLLTGGGLDILFWHRLGSSRCGRTLCAANTGAGTRAIYGNMPSADVTDVAHADLVVLWGVNPSFTGIHLVPALRDLQKRGGRLVVVDPRKTPLAAQADLHLPLLPGTDVAVALSLVNVAMARGFVAKDFLSASADGWEELAAAAAEWPPERAAAVAGIAAADIAWLAEQYAATSPALIRCGWGLERNRNGSDAVKAVLSLPAVFGKFAVRGGGYALSTSSGYKMDASLWQGAAPNTRTVNLSQLAAALAELRDPPVRVLYSYNCNPVSTIPDQSRLIAQLSRADLFTVVHEQVWTDTCAYADVVLPATTFLEHDELSRSYSGYVIQWAEPVIAPVGESWSNHQVFQALATALGFGDEGPFRKTPAELAADILSAAPGGGDFETLRKNRAVELPKPVQFVDAFPPARIQLSPPPVYRPPPADAALPLALLSPASRHAVTSTGFESLPPGTAQIDLHPDDASARGIVDGARVRMWNSLGEVVATARLVQTLRPGVVQMEKGLWRNATLNGYTATALAPGHVDEIGGGACYNDARVEVSLA